MPNFVLDTDDLNHLQSFIQYWIKEHETMAQHPHTYPITAEFMEYAKELHKRITKELER